MFRATRSSRSTSLRSSRRVWVCRGIAPICGAILICSAQASHLSRLATLDGVAGSEQEVGHYVESQLGPGTETDNTGSITKTFGAGGPHILIAAGLDEPGFVVSAITDAGYLRLKRLAEPAPHYEFGRLFQAQHVSIHTHQGRRLPGVVAAPSVHLDDGRGYSSSRGGKDLYLDIGASSRAEARAAGVEVLDPVTLNKSLIRFAGGRRLSAPWVSSRAGAAALLSLAEAFESNPPTSTVTLAFVTQQYYYNAGLLRVLERIPADRVIWLAAAGKQRSQIAPASGWSSDLHDELRNVSRRMDLDFQHASSSSVSFDPFRKKEPWPDPKSAAAVSVGVDHAGTPAETVAVSDVEALVSLLAAFCGIEWKAQPADSMPTPVANEPMPITDDDSLLALIENLVNLPGVSGGEKPIRDWIQQQLPSWAAARARTDEAGNLIIRLGRDEPPEAVFIAHLDEIGFKVKSIGADGQLTAEPLGGLNVSLFEWRPAVIHTAQGRRGALMTRSQNVDAGADSREGAKKLGVAVGDTVTVPKTFRRLLGSRITARALDDRAGCAVLLRALRFIAADAKALKAGRPVWVVFSVEEEIGLVGANALAQDNAPHRVYPIDSFVTSDSPLEDPTIAYTPLGGGFVIRAIDSSGISNRAEVERVATLARSKGIPVQYGVTSGGNDGSRFVPYGSVNVPLSWPLRYSHTAVEVSDLRDIEALEKIVTALLGEELARR